MLAQPYPALPIPYEFHREPNNARRMDGKAAEVLRLRLQPKELTMIDTFAGLGTVALAARHSGMQVISVQCMMFQAVGFASDTLRHLPVYSTLPCDLYVYRRGGVRPGEVVSDIHSEKTSLTGLCTTP